MRKKEIEKFLATFGSYFQYWPKHLKKAYNCILQNKKNRNLLISYRQLDDILRPLPVKSNKLLTDKILSLSQEILSKQKKAEKTNNETFLQKLNLLLFNFFPKKRLLLSSSFLLVLIFFISLVNISLLTNQVGLADYLFSVIYTPPQGIDPAILNSAISFSDQELLLENQKITTIVSGKFYDF